jgi:hypothetical protein
MKELGTLPMSDTTEMKGSLGRTDLVLDRGRLQTKERKEARI